MSLKFLIDKKYIPNDSSMEVISEFEKNTNADVLVFPDVHMKKGSLIANGMLVSSDHDIYLSCLGVENCGYTFGKINGASEEELIESFANFSNLLRQRNNLPKYSTIEIKKLFYKYLEKDYEKKSDLYQFLGIKSFEELKDNADILLDENILNIASNTICTLGGGNHFFELHKIKEVYDSNIVNNGDFIFMLHSDSISVGDTIYELFSDLHEMKNSKSFINSLRVIKFKFYQRKYFRKLCECFPNIKKDLHLIFNPDNNYQAIDIRTELGKILMLAHNLSSIYGEINRDAIIQTWASSQNIDYEKIGSHSHDNITAEIHKDKIKIVHRNGVQKISDDDYCILPSAMGDYSYLMKNTFNEDAYFSTNHGTGRMQDKHIARANYTAEETEKEMESKNISLFRVGNGNIAEQNMHAFKEPTAIVNEMEKHNIAKKSAKTYPIAVIKG